MREEPESREALLERLRVLGEENAFLAERAEEIALLGLVAEQMEADLEPEALLTAVLERICIVKGIPFGACLGGAGAEPPVLASYHLRRPERAEAADRFRLRPGPVWPPARAQALEGAEAGLLFERMEVARPGLGPAALVLVPMRLAPDGLCFLFADDRRHGADLEPLLPVLERVADLVRARLAHLALVAELQELTRTLDAKVADRTRELRLGEARYRTLFEHVPDGILLVDADDEGQFGRIEEANEVAASLYGYSLGELGAMDIEALNEAGSGAGLEAFEARVWRLKDGETVREERVQRRKDGTTFPVEAIGTLVRVAGHPYVLGFFRDLTERKQAEQLLLASQRTESLGVLAGGIAHDFNNLLTAIIGQTGIALECQEPGSPGRTHLERALEAAERAALLTRQMLAYAGRGRFTLQPLEVNRVIRENLGLLGAAIPKQVQVELDLEEGLPLVTGDLSQFQQVIMNLVLNGVQALGAAPGKVTVRTRATSLDGGEGDLWPLGQRPLPPGAYVGIEVADTGCGMPEDVRSRIFEPFFTTKAGGHGLGLSAVQGIIRGHRGGLAVESAPGAGTTFRIVLPGAAPDLPAPAPSPPVTAVSASRSVLVIDDESYMLEVVRDILEGAGHVALLAGSGEEGLELFGLHGDALDFILLDLSMPGIGGVETLRRLRALPNAPPVVVTSGFAEEEALAQLKGMAMSGFLQKPYRLEALLRLVEGMPGRPVQAPKKGCSF